MSLNIKWSLMQARLEHAHYTYALYGLSALTIGLLGLHRIMYICIYGAIVSSDVLEYLTGHKIINHGLIISYRRNAKNSKKNFRMSYE